MKVLVTGATGFLGKYVLQELVAHGYEVVAFGRNEAVGKALATEKITFVKGNFISYPQIYRALEGVDAVVHAGALSTVWGTWNDFYQTNVVGTENVLKASLAQGIKKLIFISSPAIYAVPKDQLDISENEAPATNDLNFYIRSKLLAEAKLKEYRKLPSVILRPRVLFGVGDPSIIPRLLKLHRTIGLPLFNDGQQVIDVTCVENVALAVRLSLENPLSVGQTYNITNGEPLPFKDILDQLLAELNLQQKYLVLNYPLMYSFASGLEKSYRFFRMKREPLLTKYMIYLLRYSQTLSIERAQRELDYQPKITISEGIKNYASHHRAH